MGGFRRCGMKRWRPFCEGVCGCIRTDVTEEILSDKHDAIRYIWPSNEPDRLVVCDWTPSFDISAKVEYE